MDEQVTHKLDYIPENWIVTRFSYLQTALLYDTQTLAEFLYMNPQNLYLQIKQMSYDFSEFPSKNRNRSLLLLEYQRVLSLQQSEQALNRSKKDTIFKLQIPNHNIFLETNTIFFRRTQLKRQSKAS